MYFKKVTNLKSTPIFETDFIKIQYGETINGIFKGIKYLHTIGQFNQVFDLIPARYLEYFYPISLMYINSNVVPHTDSGILTTINFYIEPSAYKTTFYKFTDDTNIVSQKIVNQTNGSIFDPACLTEIGSFIAEPHDVWLLDVTQPHSVYSLSEAAEPRSALVLQTNQLTFDQVSEILYEKLETL